VAYWLLNGTKSLLLNDLHGQELCYSDSWAFLFEL